MNKKALNFSLLIAVLSMLFAGLVILKQNQSANTTQIGNFLFEETIKEGLNINKIIIKNASTQITLYLDGKFWRVKQADNYYADLITINSLFKSINNAKIQAVVQEKTTPEMQLSFPKDKDEKSSSIQLQTFYGNEIMADDIIIGAQLNESHYARLASSEQPLLISGNFNLPKKLSFWLQQPLMMLEAKNIETIVTQSSFEQQMAFRTDYTQPFLNGNQQETNISPLLDQFTLLTYTAVKSAENNFLKDQTPQRTIVILLKSGLIYGIELYEVENQYWIKINLSTTTLPTKLASDYIKDSSFLYQNWFFKIDPDVGKMLLKYNIR